jgi:general secretion pathway protein H
LIEVVCVLAILALIVAVVAPALPQRTSRAQLEAYAVSIAAVLKGDRNAAIRRRMRVATEVDAAARVVQSRATGRAVRLPADVAFDTLLASRCGRYRAGSTIEFFPSGMSCGGVIAMTRSGMGYEIRVNWLTGAIEIGALNRS